MATIAYDPETKAAIYVSSDPDGAWWWSCTHRKPMLGPFTFKTRGEAVAFAIEHLGRCDFLGSPERGDRARAERG